MMEKQERDGNKAVLRTPSSAACGVAAALRSDVAETTALEPRAMSSPSALSWAG